MSDMHNFLNDKQHAIERMLDMNKRATKSQSFSPDKTAQEPSKPLRKLFSNSGVSMSTDGMLIIGLILILSEDCQDMWLFLALIYILMG